MLRYLKAMLIFARYQAWADRVPWGKSDAGSLGAFLNTTAGQKLKLLLVNQTLSQQSSALSSTVRLEYEAGYCNGQKSLIATIESLADMTQFPSEGADTDPDSI